MKSEKRKQTKREYIYQSHREGSRVVSRYVGPKSRADVELAVEDGQVATARDQLARKATQLEREATKEAEQTLEQCVFTADQWAAWQQLVYERFSDFSDPEFDREMEAEIERQRQPTVAAPPPRTRSEFAKLCEQVDLGDTQALERYRQLLIRNKRLLYEVTDLVSLARQQTVAVVAGHSIAVREATELRLKQDCESLLESSDGSCFDRLRIEMLFLLRLHALQCHVALSRNAENHTQWKFWTHMSTQATRRYLIALTKYEKATAKRMRSHASRSEQNPPPTA